MSKKISKKFKRIIFINFSRRRNLKKKYKKWKKCNIRFGIGMKRTRFTQDFGKILAHPPIYFFRIFYMKKQKKSPFFLMKGYNKIWLYLMSNKFTIKSLVTPKTYKRTLHNFAPFVEKLKPKKKSLFFSFNFCAKIQKNFNKKKEKKKKYYGYIYEKHTVIFL